MRAIPMMEAYIACSNIERFQALLVKSTDQVQRQTVETLLAAEQEKLWQIDLAEERTLTAGTLQGL
jgi:hypothetical protein